MPTNRPAETPLAIGALVAYLRYWLLVILVAALLLACGGCGLLAYSFGAQPEYYLNYRTLSAGVLFDGCRIQAGYYDAATGANDSGEVRVC